MRIVIDMQGAQGSNAMRGLGRYTISLAKGIARNRKEHQVVLALNGLFHDSIEPIISEFKNLIPKNDIRIWYAHGPLNYNDNMNNWRREAAEKIRESFLTSLKPSIILTGSFFEGFGDNVVTSIGKFNNMAPQSCILHDIIPYIYQDIYLKDPIHREWYQQKLNNFLKSDLLLANSESSRKEIIEHLDFPPEKVVTISTGAGNKFKQITIKPLEKKQILTKFNITKPFILYTGGIDYRKNIEGLIRAFSMLPKQLIDSHQLVIVCSASTQQRLQLKDLSKINGLEDDATVFTGFVSDEELIAFYNLCTVFVCPSWHEGFGIPVLEAMQCGAATIGSNVTSIPEVIGLKEALFDPRNDHSISEMLKKVLENSSFRSMLQMHGLKQSKNFSWDQSARKAIQAFESFSNNERPNKQVYTLPKQQRLKLAFISPLPPEKSGIADYCSELIPVLAKYYEIDCISDLDFEKDHPLLENCNIKNFSWFETNHSKYSRVLYHFGNSSYHVKMFRLIQRIPGTIVLHDFYLSGLISYIENSYKVNNLFLNELYKSHGFSALNDFNKSAIRNDIIWKYPCNLNIINHSNGVIVHSSYSVELASNWINKKTAKAWEKIPHLRTPIKEFNKNEIKKELGFNEGEFLVCSFGIMGPAKLNHLLLQAWFLSELSTSDTCRLIFVGQEPDAPYNQTIHELVSTSELPGKISITGWITKKDYRKYLAAADIAVQLRTKSRGETSGTILDCLNFEIATIANNHGSVVDIPTDCIYSLNENFTQDELSLALKILWDNDEKRSTLIRNGTKYLHTEHDPKKCAKEYYNSIEKFNENHVSIHQLVESISTIENTQVSESDLQCISQDIVNSFPAIGVQSIFVDISELVQTDAKSGIQRVVKSVLQELINNPPNGYRIEPVYATQNRDGYYYARDFTSQLINFNNSFLTDSPIDTSHGDIFLGLDLQPHIIPRQIHYLKNINHRGVKVIFVVYDLLAYIHPEFFYSGAKELHKKWLNTITHFDGALCISKSVAKELEEWIDKNKPEVIDEYNIDWFRLGSDIENSIPSQGLPENSDKIFLKLQSRINYLMVGTLEPRKGHQQVLAAFKQLWQKNVDVNLIIVGKQGWMMEQFVEDIANTPELNSKLFWFNEASDEFLEKIYLNSTCLIAASYGEGFGLPLIEASKYNLPVIARDIPVFREVAEDHACYFSGDSPSAISHTIQSWLEDYAKGLHKQSNGMKNCTWEESVKELITKINF